MAKSPRSSRRLLLRCPLLPNRLVLCCQRCGSLLIQLLRSLRPLLQSPGLGSLDCSLLLLELLPKLGSGLRFVLVSKLPFAMQSLVMPIAIPVVATGPITATTDEDIGSVVAGSGIPRRIAVCWVTWRGIFLDARVAWRITRRLLGACRKQHH